MMKEETNMGAPPPPGFNYNSPPPGGAPPGGAAPGQSRFMYADFLPTPLTAGGMFTMPKYERFDILMQKANQWLAGNPSVKAKTCESLEVKAAYNSTGVDTQTSIYMESGKHMTAFVRCLRLWLVPNDSPEPQQLGYLNVVPGCVEQGGVFSFPKFEPFGNCINTINNMFRQNPLPGRIVNVETQDIKFNSWKGSVDPDETSWYESGDMNTQFLNLIRVFYERGPPIPEEIGCVDFQPICREAGGLMKLPVFSSFYEMFSQASQWMQQQPGINIVNIQSIDYRVEHSWGGGMAIDTQRSHYYESGKMATSYLRILRVVYTRPVGAPPSASPPPLLTYRTFMPAQLTAGGMFSVPQYETMSQNMQRASAWVNYTGAKVIAAESVPVIFNYRMSANPEVTYSRKSGEMSTFYVFGLRIYLEGQYQDPPPGILPPIPPVQQGGSTECCNIL